MGNPNKARNPGFARVHQPRDPGSQRGPGSAGQRPARAAGDPNNAVIKPRGPGRTIRFDDLREGDLLSLEEHGVAGRFRVSLDGRGAVAIEGDRRWRLAPGQEYHLMARGNMPGTLFGRSDAFPGQMFDDGPQFESPAPVQPAG